VSIVDRILRIGEGRTLKKLDAIATQVEALAETYADFTDEDLKEVTTDLKERYIDGESLDGLLPEAFAAVCEAADRVLGMRPFHVQIMGGAALHLGNIAEQSLDPGAELAAGEGHMVAMHAKDVRPGEPRRVEMGTGIVDWDRSFALLTAQDWSGRLMIEMWNDDAPDSLSRCTAARAFIEDRAASAGLLVVSP